MSARDETDEGHLRLTPVDLPVPVQVDIAALRTDDDFGNAAFELLKEASMTLIWLAGRIPSIPYERDAAIRRALVKRLNLLGKSLLCDIANNSGYQQTQIVRQIIEVASNYLYLARMSPGSAI